MSTLKADTIQNTSGGAVTLTKQHAAKGWFNYDNSGTAAIRDSFNFSGLTDDGTGQATLSYTNNMSNENYASSAINNYKSGLAHSVYLENEPPKTSTIKYRTNRIGTGDVNHEYVIGSVHGDLA